MVEAITAKETADLTTRLRAKVLEMMGDLIPEERWEKLIEGEISRFFEQDQQISIRKSLDKSSSRYSYDQDKYKDISVLVTPFRALVYDELAKVANARVKAMVLDLTVDIYADRGPARGMIDELVKKNFMGIIVKGFETVLREGILRSLDTSDNVTLTVDKPSSLFDADDVADPNHPLNPNSPTYNPSWVRKY